MKQLKPMLTAIVAVFGLFAFRTQSAQGGNFNFRHIFAALCLSAILGISAVPGIGNIAHASPYTDIHDAAAIGYPKWVRQHILSGQDPNARRKNGRTPLHLAAINNHTGVMAELIRYGAKIEAKEKYGKTPLHFAGGFGSPDVAKVLIEAGAEIDAKDRDGRTPLDWAVHEGKPEVAKVLYKAGANNDFANALSDGGKHYAKYTNLHWAIIGIAGQSPGWGFAWSAKGGDKTKRDNVLKALINAGADIERKAILDFTPLHQAALQRNVEAVRILIDAGADPHAIAKTHTSRHAYGGEKPIDIARRVGSREASDLLLHYMERLAREERERKEKAAFEKREREWREWVARNQPDEIYKKITYCIRVQQRSEMSCRFAAYWRLR